MFCAQLCLVAAISNIDVTPASAQEQLCGFDSAQNFVCGPGTKVVPTIPDKYTAIALSSDRRFFGVSWGAYSQQRAEQMALGQCRKQASDCEVQN
jgi:hypothetical protein